MKSLLTLLCFLLFWQGGRFSLTRIGKTNELKQQAEEAFAEGRYAEAAQAYQVLLEKWNETSDAVRLNHANALFRAQQLEAAAEAYRQIAEGTAGSNAKSHALQQLGYLATENEKLQDALLYFKQALLANPDNTTARLNYELVWSRLNKQQKDPEEEEKKDPQEDEKDQPKVVPSPWAIQQKARADALYQQFRYNEALQLMQESLQKDSTIAAFNDYIQRLGDVSEIDQ